MKPSGRRQQGSASTSGPLRRDLPFPALPPSSPAVTTSSARVLPLRPREPREPSNRGSQGKPQVHDPSNQSQICSCCSPGRDEGGNNNAEYGRAKIMKPLGACLCFFFSFCCDKTCNLLSSISRANRLTVDNGYGANTGRTLRGLVARGLDANTATIRKPFPRLLMENRNLFNDGFFSTSSHLDTGQPPPLNST